MLLFVVFYSLAALHYPGGSWNVPAQTGFHLKDNYLCDLLDAQTISGLENTASVYAKIALGFLCLSLMVLWWYLPKLFFRKAKALVFMRWTGMLAMGTTLLLGPQNHDVVVRIAGVFGTISLMIALVSLYLDHFKGLFVLGVLCLVLFLANYYIYESEVLLKQLPVIQKITFTACILWFVFLDLALIKKFRGFKH
ncbi:hypothetical protein GCM10022260_24500 [Gaetbulibacter aestuarii]